MTKGNTLQITIVAGTSTILKLFVVVDSETSICTEFLPLSDIHFEVTIISET